MAIIFAISAHQKEKEAIEASEKVVRSQLDQAREYMDSLNHGEAIRIWRTFDSLGVMPELVEELKKEIPMSIASGGNKLLNEFNYLAADAKFEEVLALRLEPEFEALFQDEVLR